MKTKIHLPRSSDGEKIGTRPVKIETDLPVIFLAGPILNAPKWHEEAIRLLLRKNKAIFIASPTRELSSDLTELVEKDDQSKYEIFPRQRAWEQYYLYAASKKGCILFWLPGEAEEKEVPDKIYAHMTMLELGGWIARCKMDQSINLVIGTDGNFPEWSTVEYEIRTELQDIRKITIWSSLSASVQEAVDLIFPDDAPNLNEF